MEYIADTAEWKGYPENIPLPQKKMLVCSRRAIPHRPNSILVAFYSLFYVTEKR